MANNNITGARANSITSLPVQDDSLVAPDPQPVVVGSGHPGASSLDPKSKPVATATIAGATPISANAVKVTGTALTVGAATEAARNESSKLTTLTSHGKNIAGVGKSVHGIAKKVAGAADDEATTTDRMQDAAGALKDTAKMVSGSTKLTDNLSAKTIRNLKVGGYGAGAVAGAFNVYTNAGELRENLGKAFDGDPKAIADSVNNTAQIISGSARVVTDVADGAKLLRVGGAAAVVAGKSVVGVALKAAPIVGAAIGTAKATIDMFKDPSVENGLKLAANAIGLIPLPGMSAVSMVAAASLENPKVMAATAGAVRSAGKWASGVADRMAANAATMEPLGLAM